MGKGTPISQEMWQNIRDDLDLGYSYADIADRYGVSYSTIRRVKKSSEAPTAMENAPEDIKDSGISAATSIPEPAEKVKPEPDNGGQYRTEPDSSGQTEQPSNSRQLDYEEQSRTVPNFEEQREYITDILKATLEDIEEEIRGFEERIQTLSERLEERRQKQAYLRDFIKSMR